MEVYIRMSDTDTNDYDKLKKALLTKYNFTKDGYRKRFRDAKPETEETKDAKPETEETKDQFVIRLQNY